MPWKYGRSIYCAKNSQVHLRGNVIKGTIIREMSFRYVKTAVDLWGSAGVLRAQAWASPGSGLPRRALGPSSSWSSWCSYCRGFTGNLATGGVRWSFLVVRTSLYQKPESLKVLSVNEILGLDVSKKVYVQPNVYPPLNYETVFMSPKRSLAFKIKHSDKHFRYTCSNLYV